MVDWAAVRSSFRRSACHDTNCRGNKVNHSVTALRQHSASDDKPVPSKLVGPTTSANKPQRQHAAFNVRWKCRFMIRTRANCARLRFPCQCTLYAKNLVKDLSPLISARPSLVFSSPVAPSRRTRVGMPVIPYFSDNFDLVSRSENGRASHGISL